MLSDFVNAHRSEIIARCRARVTARMAPRPTALELEYGIPLFLDELVDTLRSKLTKPDSTVATTATKHGSELLRTGFTVAQVISDYGDACQTIAAMAIEQDTTITTQEFKALNLCLDEATADAVTEYQRQREIASGDERSERAAEDLGFFAHELRNLLGTATLAFDALRRGNVGVAGSTAALLGRSLERLRDLVDHSLSTVRLKAGIGATERIVVPKLLEEIEISAIMEAKARGNRLSIQVRDGDCVVEADRQILASIMANLVQNAFKHAPAGSHVVVRSSATAEHVQLEVEDECGGLAEGKAERLFKPFVQGGTDRSGLGLGLAISKRGAEALGGTLRVRNLPGKGCVFTLELPRLGTGTKQSGRIDKELSEEPAAPRLH